MSEILGTFEQAVLLAIIRLDGDAYGRAVWQDVQLRLQRDVAAGAVYATLDRLEEKELICSCLRPGTAVRAGRPRRYYRIEHVGIRALNGSKRAVDHLWHGLRWPVKGRA